MIKKLFYLILFFGISRNYAQISIDSLSFYLKNKQETIAPDSLNFLIALELKKEKNLLYGSYLKNALKTSQEKSDIQLTILNELAKFYRLNGQIDSAIIIFNQGLDYSAESNKSDYTIKLASNLGNLYRATGNFDQALYYLFKADSLGSKLNDEIVAAKISINIAIVYTALEEYNTSLSYFYRVLKIKGLDGKFYSACYTNMSGIFMELNTYDSAIFYGEKSIEIKKQIGDTKGLSGAYTNLGVTYTRLQNYEEAAKNINLALDFYTKNNDLSGIIKSYNNLGKIHSAQLEYEKASNFLLRADSLNENNQLFYQAIHTNELLAELYENKGDWEQALKYKNIFFQLQDSIHTKDKINAISELQTKYKTEKLLIENEIVKANEIISKEKLKNSQILTFALIIISLLFFTIGLYIYSRSRIIKKQKVKLDAAYLKLEESKKNELALSNLKALKSQMNPHFIFNLLNSIQHLVLKGDIENSYGFINQFAGLVRNTLDYSDREKISLDEEIQLLTVYLQLEKLRFNDNFEYEIIKINLKKEIQIPPMLIQPFIENALVHGLLHKKGLRKLKITIEAREVVVCTVEDNGVGRVKAKEIRERQRGNHKSFSTAAIEKRFAILSDYYKEEIGYTYYDLDATNEMSTKVVLRIPFDKFRT